MSYRQLTVWAKAMALAKEIYRLADLMPKREEYRLTAQMVRAAISIPANIAEGRARATRKDYAHFISIARGSVAELETLLLLAESAALLPADEVAGTLASAEEVGRMLNTMHAKLKNPNT
ncbi:MAG: four helix bundle protein [Hyphomonadaceae bacterium]